MIDILDIYHDVNRVVTEMKWIRAETCPLLRIALKPVS